MNIRDLKFRDLKADEIDVRISQIKENWLTLLLYKDARVDQNILDETVGAFNWQRDHKELKGNIYCGISIYDEDTKQWITKWDCGKESFSDSEKGESSDSFKRSGFNWGIGRELYTAPFILIPRIVKSNGKDIQLFELSGNTNKPATKTKFEVEKIQIENKVITGLAIKNDKGIRVFTYVKKEEEK